MCQARLRDPDAAQLCVELITSYASPDIAQHLLCLQATDAQRKILCPSGTMVPAATKTWQAAIHNCDTFQTKYVTQQSSSIEGLWRRCRCSSSGAAGARPRRGRGAAAATSRLPAQVWLKRSLPSGVCWAFASSAIQWNDWPFVMMGSVGC